MTDPHGAEALVARWREQASGLRRYGAPGQADALDQCAGELERTLRTTADDLLSLHAAARLSGFSADHLGRLIRQGKLENLGRPHAPRVRRGDLPQKPALAPRRAGAADMGSLTRDALHSKHGRRAP
jgi:hypothetical protein